MGTSATDDGDTGSPEKLVTETKHWMGDWTTWMAAPASAATTWGPYFDAEFGPSHRVRSWIARKISSSGVNIARRGREQREELRAAYEAESMVPIPTTGRLDTPASSSTRCSGLPTPPAWAASGSICLARR